MSAVSAKVNSSIELLNAPGQLTGLVKADLTFDNPDYESALLSGRSTRGIPKKIRLYEDKDGVLKLPRGYWSKLVQISRALELEVDSVGETIVFEPNYPPKDIKLKDYQQPWVEQMLSHNQGVGVAPPGAGKTICGLEIYAKLGQPCLWVTHTKRLARQAQKRAKEFLGVEAGLIGSGKEEIKHFTVGLVPTLVRRDLQKYARHFGLIITDECFPAGTMVDGKPIETLKVGDKVTSFNEKTGTFDKSRVVRLFKNKAESLTRITMSSGRVVVCTPNHPFWTKAGWKQAALLTPDDEVLEYGHKTRLSSELSPLRKPDKAENHTTQGRRRPLLSPLQRETEGKEEEKIQSPVQELREDDFVQRERRLEQGSGREAPLLQRMCRILQEQAFFGNNVRYKQEICQRQNEEKQSYARSRVPGKSFPYSPQHGTQASLDRRKRQRNNETTKETIRSSRAGVERRVTSNNEKVKQSSVLYLYRHSAPGEENSHRGRRRISRIKKNSGSGSEKRGFSSWSRVVSVEVLEPGSDGKFGGLCPDGEVYNIEVERNHTYVADGFVVHNCHHLPATTFTQVVSAFPAHYRYGLTATPYRDDQLEEIIFQTIGPQLAYVDKPTLRAQGKLITPRVICRPTKFYFPYDSRSKKFGYDKLSKALAEDEPRNDQIASDVIVQAVTDENNICIVLVGRITHGEKLYEKISPVIEETGFVHSKMTDKQSDQVLEDFSNGKLRVLVATYRMLAEGFDYQPSNRLFLTAPFKGRTLIEQACGRIERTYPGKYEAIVFDYVDSNVAVLRRQAEARLDIYEANDTPFTTNS